MVNQDGVIYVTPHKVVQHDNPMYKKNLSVGE
jgi:hypothetical protein